MTRANVDLGLKRLIGHVASMAAGCMYCRAHTATSAMRLGVPAEKLAALADYRTSALFSDAERAPSTSPWQQVASPTMSLTRFLGACGTTGAMGRSVRILGVISLFGFFNRWNDSLATTLGLNLSKTPVMCWGLRAGTLANTNNLIKRKLYDE